MVQAGHEAYLALLSPQQALHQLPCMLQVCQSPAQLNWANARLTGNNTGASDKPATLNAHAPILARIPRRETLWPIRLISSAVRSSSDSLEVIVFPNS
ncbi:MAG: hypothetical protein DMG08_25130 [Acidobacteria bacterium]|nr:MAG: hypothetical protein DMG08_25130 [Acidobacteriota bacterium]